MTHEELLATANVALIFAEQNSDRELSLRLALQNYCHAYAASCDTTIEPGERALHIYACNRFSTTLRALIQ